MDVAIGNSRIIAEIDLAGAQMRSIKSVNSGIECLWQGDEKSWADRAPNLFPIVGMLPDNRYTCYGAEYQMPIHGFIRKCSFEVMDKSATKVIVKNSATEDTKSSYPFDYDFMIGYETVGNTLEITHKVKNNSGWDMPFSIGEHPGFRVPLSAGSEYSDYFIEFEFPETTDRYMLEDGLIASNEPYLKNSAIIPMDRSVFNRGAIILKHLKSSYAVIRNRKDKHTVRVDFAGYPYLGIWAKPNADYVCIEPWRGLPSSKDSSKDIFLKEGIMVLAPKTQFECKYSITVDC